MGRQRTTAGLVASGALVAAFALPPAAGAAGNVCSPAASAPRPMACNGFVDGHATDRAHLFATPFDPADASDQTAADALFSPNTPETDLHDLLGALASASDQGAFDIDKAHALDILLGNPIAKAAYSGIPLLNANAPDRVKTVPDGLTIAQRTVTVREVRYGARVLTDTAALRFDAPDKPFRIRYEITELGSEVGGQLNPAPLLKSGTGQHSAIEPLALDGLTSGLAMSFPTGTKQANRFTSARADAHDISDANVDEQAGSALQTVSVDMPEPSQTAAILDPDFRAGAEKATAITPLLTDADVTAYRARFGADRDAAIAKLDPASPERVLYDTLKDLRFADRAQAGGLRAQVEAMLDHTALPAGTQTGASADVVVVISNDETYVTRRRVRLAPGAGPLKVLLVNRDGVARRISTLDLHARDRVLGAEDWGAFDWTDRTPGSEGLVGAGESRTLTITPSDDAFALWVGDLASGGQAHAVIDLDRAAHRQQAVRFGAGAFPVHSQPDATGNVYVTLAGQDTIGRIAPAADLADAKVERFPLPGGRPDASSSIAPLAPSDISVDGKGIVWVTLASGNGIARLDPAKLQDGTSQGITIIKLGACATATPACKPEIPPVPNEQPTRRPTRLKTILDGRGNTILWFVEAGASSIGALRVDPSGAVVPNSEAHFSCGCDVPESLDLGTDGSVWFNEVFENRIGRIRPDRTRPFTPSAASTEHYTIPDKVRVDDAAAPNGSAMTSLPLSIVVDGRNRVWFSESSLSAVSWLDPALAKDGTSDGIHAPIKLADSDFRSPAAPADVTVDRANSFWWAGEYGDQIEQLGDDGARGLHFRGSVRRGLTEAPVPDVNGNLWVTETGGNLVTRISGVTRGPLVSFGLPPEFTARPSDGTVSGVRVRDDATSVSVTVSRGGTQVAGATVPVTADGAFTVARGDWTGPGAGDPLRAGDAVRVTQTGPFERVPVAFRVADLSASVDGGGNLKGTATSDGAALSDSVDVAVDGGPSLQGGAIDTGTGAWSRALESPLASSARGTVSWSAATVAGVFRTTTRFGTQTTTPTTPPPSGGGGGTSQAPAPNPSPAPQVPAAGGGQSAAPAPKASAPAADPRSAGCTARTLLSGTGSARRVLLLGDTRAQIETCLGKPRSATATQLRYDKGLTVRLTGGRATSYELRGALLRTSGGQAIVGSTLTALRPVFTGLRRDPQTKRFRALVPRSDGQYADVAITAAGGRATVVRVTLRPRTGLDAFGRSLLKTRKAGA